MPPRGGAKKNARKLATQAAIKIFRDLIQKMDVSGLSKITSFTQAQILESLSGMQVRITHVPKSLSLFKMVCNPPEIALKDCKQRFLEFNESYYFENIQRNSDADNNISITVYGLLLSSISTSNNELKDYELSDYSFDQSVAFLSAQEKNGAALDSAQFQKRLNALDKKDVKAWRTLKSEARMDRENFIFPLVIGELQKSKLPKSLINELSLYSIQVVDPDKMPIKTRSKAEPFVSRSKKQIFLNRATDLSGRKLYTQFEGAVVTLFEQKFGRYPSDAELLELHICLSTGELLEEMWDDHQSLRDLEP